MLQNGVYPHCVVMPRRHSLCMRVRPLKVHTDTNISVRFQSVYLEVLEASGRALSQDFGYPRNHQHVQEYAISR